MFQVHHFQIIGNLPTVSKNGLASCLLTTIHLGEFGLIQKQFDQNVNPDDANLPKEF